MRGRGREKLSNIEERRNWERFGSRHIRLKARRARLRWYGHILKMDEGNRVKQMMEMEVRGTRAKGG